MNGSAALKQPETFMKMSICWRNVLWHVVCILMKDTLLMILTGVKTTKQQKTYINDELDAGFYIDL